MCVDRSIDTKNSKIHDVVLEGGEGGLEGGGGERGGDI